MKDKPGDKARLSHIAGAISEIEQYIQGMDYEGFKDDSKKRFAPTNF